MVNKCGLLVRFDASYWIYGFSVFYACRFKRMHSGVASFFISIKPYLLKKDFGELIPQFIFYLLLTENAKTKGGPDSTARVLSCELMKLVSCV